MFRFGSLFYKSYVSTFNHARRWLYGVKHNAKRGIFYIRLEDDDIAVLSYKAEGRILDMRSIDVPSRHRGYGLARLLAEAAFTYAIVNDYYLLINCEYAQRLYRATKSPDLEERVLGPKHILEDSRSDETDKEIAKDLSKDYPGASSGE